MSLQVFLLLHTSEPTFSEQMLSASFTSSTFTVRVSSELPPMLQAFVGLQVAMRPLILLHRRICRPNTTYVTTLTTGVKDVAGNAMTTMTKTWSFTTSAPPDTTPPTVSSPSRADVATGVPVTTYVPSYI